ncbi:MULTISPECIES: ABC transporter permease [Bradyrhizobium]|uniref:ABC transporter permease n=1 Tax=Bradyrhizobium TaxID=374 RepID=UPI00039D5471|nr:ABC transporter permease [Bradyrhizobium denitrificans]MCL8483754.1 ABC transporter permease [Bradyrhizobium denitrificans]
MKRLLHPPLILGTIVLAGVVVMALLAQRLFPGDPMDMVAVPFTWPGQDETVPLGSDLMGRDLLAGIFHGARVSLLVGASAATIALTIGVTIGAISGFYGGAADAALGRITEFFQTIPAFLLAVILVAIMRPSIGTIILALGISSWTGVARLVRAEFLTLREREFVRASEALGASDLHLITREILPNVLTPILASTGILVAQAILSEAGLSFLGLGDPNLISWGSMIGIGRDALRTGWYMSAIPGAAIMLTVVALNFLSDGLHAVLSPRTSLRNA